MKILEFLQESNGTFSNVRLLSLFLTLCFCADYIVHIIRGEPYDPSLTMIGVVMGALGLKVAQKPFEEKVVTEPPKQ